MYLQTIPAATDWHPFFNAIKKGKIDIESVECVAPRPQELCPRRFEERERQYYGPYMAQISTGYAPRVRITLAGNRAFTFGGISRPKDCMKGFSFLLEHSVWASIRAELKAPAPETQESDIKVKSFKGIVNFELRNIDTECKRVFKVLIKGGKEFTWNGYRFIVHKSIRTDWSTETAEACCDFYTCSHYDSSHRTCSGKKGQTMDQVVSEAIELLESAGLDKVHKALADVKSING